MEYDQLYNCHILDDSGNVMASRPILGQTAAHAVEQGFATGAISIEPRRPVRLRVVAPSSLVVHMTVERP